MPDKHEEGIKLIQQGHIIRQAVQEFDQLVQQGHIIRIGNHVAYDGTVGVTRIQRLVSVIPDRQNLILHHDKRAFEEYKAEKTRMANFERDHLT